jgi:hypothetical protein
MRTRSPTCRRARKQNKNKGEVMPQCEGGGLLLPSKVCVCVHVHVCMYVCVSVCACVIAQFTLTVSKNARTCSLVRGLSGSVGLFSIAACIYLGLVGVLVGSEGRGRHNLCCCCAALLSSVECVRDGVGGRQSRAGGTSKLSRACLPLVGSLYNRHTLSLHHQDETRSSQTCH